MTDSDSDDKFSVRQYHRDMDKVMKGEYVDLGRLGLPKYSIDSSGLMFLLMLPVMFLWLVFKDPFYGWIKPRKIAMFMAILFTLVMFALMVFVGVQYDLGVDSVSRQTARVFCSWRTWVRGGWPGSFFCSGRAPLFS